MTIRRALVWLVMIALIPVVLAGGVSLFALYTAQQASAGERALERVRALRIALDVEIAATQRLLATTAERRQLREQTVLATPELTDALRRLVRANQMWAAAMIVEPDGTETLRVGAAGASGQRAPSLDEVTRQRVFTSAAPQLSPLIGAQGGPLFTFVAVPVLNDGRAVRLIAVAVPNEAWLDFLEQLPVDRAATLTLNDGNGRIVARTRDNSLWAGRQSRPDYWERTRQASESYFSSTSLEGEAFLSAFSHLKHGDWVLGTGFPADVVTRAVWTHAGWIGGLLLAAMVAALLLAFWAGRRIAQALQDLAALASTPEQAGGANRHGAAHGPLPLAEAEAVRRGLRAAFMKESEARNAAEEARRAAEKARAEREQFVATLAHELRNPLGAIQNALLLVDRPEASPEQRGRSTSILKRQVAQLTRLMADLFEASRPGDAGLRLVSEPVDLADVCRDAVDALQTEGRLSRVTLDVELRSVMAHADPARLQQVVANVLGNAAKFSPEGAQVRLTLSREATNADITVADAGLGIAPELIDRIFEPFVQGRPQDGQGLGLGLHVVRRIVELHGGTVKAVSSGANQGTTVTVRLPALPAAGVHAVQKDR